MSARERNCPAWSICSTPEGIGHTNGSFGGAFALFQDDRLRGLQRKAAFGVSAQGESDLGDGCSGHGD